MTTINGNNITYTTSNFLGPGTIIRDSLTGSDSNDVTPSGTDISTSFGSLSGQILELTIVNSSPNFNIILNPGSGVTMYPNSTDTIQPLESRSYKIITSSATTYDMYSSSQIGSASENSDGIITTSSQTIAGVKTFTSLIAMSTNRITNLADPTAVQDAVTLNYLDNYCDILYSYDSVGGLAISNTPQVIPLNINTINSSGFTIGAGGIFFTLPRAGFYEISYFVSTRSNGTGGATRAALTGRLQSRSTGGGSFGTIPGSDSSTYMREQGNNVTTWGTGKTMFFSVVNSTTSIRLVFFRNLSTTGLTKANESSISIKYIKPI